jgi:hypothetical protein
MQTDSTDLSAHLRSLIHRALIFFLNGLGQLLAPVLSACAVVVTPGSWCEEGSTLREIRNISLHPSNP